MTHRLRPLTPHPLLLTVNADFHLNRPDLNDVVGVEDSLLAGIKPGSIDECAIRTVQIFDDQNAPFEANEGMLTVAALFVVAAGLRETGMVDRIGDRLLGRVDTEGAALGRLVRRADVIVCSTAAAERVRGLAGSTVQVLIDDRALDPRAIEMLATLLVQQNGDRPTAAPAPRRLGAGRKSREGATRATVPGK